MAIDPSVRLLEIKAAEVLHNASPARLYEHAVAQEGAAILASGALATFSGEKTGRSPKDKRIVKHPETPQVWWGNVNIPVSEESLWACRRLSLDFLNSRPTVYVVDGFAGWEPAYRIKIRGDPAPGPITPCSCTTS